MSDDTLKTPDQIVDEARLIAQRQGKVLLSEMIAHLDEMIAARCESASAGIATHGVQNWDMEYWGHRTWVLESLLSFLQRIDSDEEARDYLVRRFRRGVIRNVSMDREDGREAAWAGGAGDEIG